MMKSVRAFAPATVANVSCGFDILGFAIDAMGDEVEVRLREEPGLVVVSIEGDEGRLPYEVEKTPVRWLFRPCLTSWASRWGWRST